jgi:octaprenyl-diphosphate synthase
VEISNLEEFESNEDQDKYVNEVVAHLDKTQGKMIRSKLLIDTMEKTAVSHRMSLGNALPCAKIAMRGIELIHNASIIHDDMLDNNSKRRGVASLHAEYGNNIALVTGDVLFARALTMLGKLNDGYVISHALGVFRHMAEGQLAESAWASNKYTPQIEEIIDVMRRKTGVLMGFSVRLGAYFVLKEQFSPELVEDLDDIAKQGEYYGIAYQIQDDIEDMDEDASNGTQTIPIIYGKERALQIAEYFKHESAINLL